MSVLVGLQIDMWGKVNKHLKWCKTTLEDNISYCKCTDGEDRTWEMSKVAFFSFLINLYKEKF